MYPKTNIACLHYLSMLHLTKMSNFRENLLLPDEIQLADQIHIYRFFDLFQSLLRRFKTWGDRLFGKTLQIQHPRITPPDRFPALNLQPFGYIGVDLRVQVWFGQIPLLLHPDYRVGAGVKTGAEFFPQCSSGAELCVPAHMMKS